MTAPDFDVKPEPPSERGRSRGWIWIVVGVLAAVLVLVVGLVVGVGAGLFHPREGRSLPVFASLAENPDRSLHGTVAYYANDTGCVRIVAAAGQPSRTVLCVSPKDLAVKPELGMKPAGPQLAWLPGERLEITMFSWSARSGGPPNYHAGWQKIVDVRTGKVTNVPVTQVPSSPLASSGPTVSPTGQRVAYALDQPSGRVTVTLTDSTGTRTLLSAHGPGEYTYGFGPVFWAPNWQWIAASDDGRILIITPGTDSVTRVLVTGSGGGAGGGTAGPAFAVTSADLFSAAK